MVCGVREREYPPALIEKDWPTLVDDTDDTVEMSAYESWCSLEYEGLDGRSLGAHAEL